MVRFETHPLSMLTGHGIDSLFRVAGNLQAQMSQAQPSQANEEAGAPNRALAPRARVTASEEAAKLVMFIPGFGPEHLDISVERASVTVRGEREDGPAGDSFERTFKLPFPVDTDGAEANVEFGVLTLELPRLGADKPQRIAIRGADQATPEPDAEAAE